MDDVTLATPVEVAEFLRTNTTKLTQDRHRGIGPKFVKHGRRVLYRWADVYAFIDSNIVEPTDARSTSRDAVQS